jgi:hypothetical protein
VVHRRAANSAADSAPALPLIAHDKAILMRGSSRQPANLERDQKIVHVRIVLGVALE